MAGEEHWSEYAEHAAEKLAAELAVSDGEIRVVVREGRIVELQDTHRRKPPAASRNRVSIG